MITNNANIHKPISYELSFYKLSLAKGYACNKDQGQHWGSKYSNKAVIIEHSTETKVDEHISCIYAYNEVQWSIYKGVITTHSSTYVPLKILSGSILYHYSNFTVLTLLF